MRGFSEALLLVAFTLLLPSLFVNGQEEFLRPTANFKPARRSTVLRGLLVSRQAVCDPGFVGCEATGCCPTAWNCCIDGNCCDPTTYCALASNGIIGCCPTGLVCSGPVGGPTTILGPPPAPTPTVPVPVPVPTPTVVPVPTPTVVPVPVPTTPTIPVVPVPTTPIVNPPQTTINPTTSTTSSQKPSSSAGLPLLNGAGQAQLSRPLMVLVGILLAAVN